MKPVIVPTTDVNSESALITEWYVEDRAQVRKDDVIAEIETSKAVVEVTAPEDGFLLHGAPVGAQVALADPIALLFDDLAELERHAEAAAAVADGGGEQRPRRARERAGPPPGRGARRRPRLAAGRTA